MELMRNRRAGAAGSLGILLLLLVSSCGRPVTADRPATLKEVSIVAGVVPDETNSALFVAQEHGFFAAHGLHVTIKSIVSTEDAVPQLLDGSLDVAAGQLPTWISAQARGLGPFRVLAPGVELTPNVDEIVTLGTSRISDAGQLAGKVIAVNAAAGNGPLLVDNILSIYFVSPDHVTYKVESFPDMSAALASHQVDAAYCTEPWCTEMAEQLGALSIADLSEGNAQEMLIGGYTVTVGWMKKNPRTAAAFAASIEEAIHLMDTNLGVVWKAFEVGLGVTPQLAPLLQIGTFPSTVTTNEILQIAHLMVKFGELSPNTNVKALATALTGGKLPASG
jgi:NitT/TauT family transport system substrate-binding protein